MKLHRLYVWHVFQVAGCSWMYGLTLMENVKQKTILKYGQFYTYNLTLEQSMTFNTCVRPLE